mmetsp:Transcript_8364/g.24036  ORF Transcript_8364/g.24036 Transcript_8364/m.24036 type:complete len:90 (-) Transcript_8364:336-605(-)
MGVRHACGDSSVLGFEHSAISGRGQPTIDGVYLFTESWLRSPAGKKFWVNAFRKMLADEARESSGDGRVTRTLNPKPQTLNRQPQTLKP